MHEYTYDAENRITEVKTSENGRHWETEARYEYYKHGPLARAMLGGQMVQGIDYAYTLQGWLKGVNSVQLSSNHDMGMDGAVNFDNQYTAKDAYGFSLNYFAGDYQAITGTIKFPEPVGYFPAQQYRPLYNGNISSMAESIDKMTASGMFGGKTLLYNYKYDQLNRITGMDAYNNFSTANNNWNGMTKLDQYQERVSYDGNGNIQKYLRHGNLSGADLVMDSLTYKYDTASKRNRLLQVWDNVPVATYGAYRDLDKQDSANNYVYDTIGNIVADKSEKINSIVWSVYGKILEINRTATANNNVTKIVYTYDAQGNRISSTTTRSGTSSRDYVWYVRDAQGNAMGVYKATGGTNMGSLYPVLAERYIYGSSRLGSYNLETSVRDGNEHLRNVYSYNFSRGLRNYELSNHLGNVLTTISDKKFGVPSGGNSSLIDYYTADVTNATSYYPFGSIMPARNWSNGGKYRYGFNGKENDSDVKGSLGTQQDYGMRIYDPRVGRFLSVDPLTRSYPSWSPYPFSMNRPVDGIDLDGLEFYSNSNSRIHLGLQFDPKLKRITSFSTTFRRNTLPDRLNEFIDKQNQCPSCIGSTASVVRSFNILFKNPFVENQEMAEVTDIDMLENSAMGPKSQGSNVAVTAKNKKEYSQNIKNRNFFTEGASARIGKANLVLAAIDVVSKGLELYGNHHLNEIVRVARAQSDYGAVEVIGIIQNTLDNSNRLNKFATQESLIGLANYLLSGQTIENYEVKNGKGAYEKNQELMDIGDELYDEYMSKKTIKKFREDSQKGKSNLPDNTSVTK